MSLSTKDIIVELDKVSKDTDLQELFPSVKPLQLEVGSGKGIYIRSMAKKHKDINFLGIEWAHKFYRHFVDRAVREDLTNVRVLRTDAADFLEKYVKSESVTQFNIFFPDPWPKNRQNKRRFFVESNIKNVHRVLVPGGKLLFTTDHLGYFEWTKAMFFANSNITPLFKKVKFPKLDSAREGEIVGTNYERKYMKEGREFYKLAFEKIG